MGPNGGSVAMDSGGLGWILHEAAQNFEVF
jgi:hypothetical protein